MHKITHKYNLCAKITHFLHILLQNITFFAEKTTDFHRKIKRIPQKKAHKLYTMRFFKEKSYIIFQERHTMIPHTKKVTENSSLYNDINTYK